MIQQQSVPARPRLLLLGDAVARPEGLERALARAGYQVIEGVSASDAGLAADLVLAVTGGAEASLHVMEERARAGGDRRVPCVIVLADGDRQGVARVLAAGAADAVAAPVHLPELVARIAARFPPTDGTPIAVAASDLDTLTGCGSLAALEQRLDEEFARARRYSLSFSLILLDIDGLDAVNTRLGPAAGDRLLQQLGGLLRREVRAPDFVSRCGGDEFALVLPETGLAGARGSVTRLRRHLASLPLPPSVSAGIVTVPHPAAERADDLFALAEAALLRAKGQDEERIGTAEAVGPW